MSDLITVADLVNRRIDFANVAEAEAAIADASAVARLCVSGELDDIDATDAPGGVVAVVVAMVRRGLSNPTGLAQETLGDYSYATGGQGVATIYATAREKKLLRQAVGSPGIGGIDLEGDVPIQPSELTSEVTFNPDDPDA